jgi:predicted enzyme related to lactoylglutathione lyase
MTSSGPKAVWFEIPVDDLDRAAAFYEQVLGATFVRESVDGNDMALFTGTSDADGIVGALAKGEVYRPSRTGPIVYLGVADIDAVLARAQARGAPNVAPASARERPPADQSSFVPSGTSCSGTHSVTRPCASWNPVTRHSDMIDPICFGGKFTTATTRLPTSSSGR